MWFLLVTSLPPGHGALLGQVVSTPTVRGADSVPLGVQGTPGERGVKEQRPAERGHATEAR